MAANHAFDLAPLPGGANFGTELRLPGASVATLLARTEDDPGILKTLLNDNGGFLLLRGLRDIDTDPSLLVALSRRFGPEVEDYHRTLTKATSIHTEVREILIVSNRPPIGKPAPAPPDPPRAADGGLPIQFPHRRGWHTDQSYRRPPPDISLFYGHRPAPKGQGQTLYANGTLAYAALPEDLRQLAEGLVGLHVQPGSGRSEDAVRDGVTPKPLAPHERCQPQPVVRIHPETGAPALYLCEAGQMDWIEGPLVGYEPGLHGDGAKLLYRLMEHFTAPDFTYAHEWEQGDLVIYDNRCLIHAATWFDGDTVEREMWRTTVRGNPGAEYAGEADSWVPTAAE